MTISIDSLEFDDDNIGHIEPRVWAEEVLEAFDDEHRRILKNAGSHRAPYIFVGRTLGGRYLKVAIAPTATPGRWRVATAMDATPAELTKLKLKR